MDLVLLHSPLVGPATWRPVADELAARGRDAVVPTCAAWRRRSRRTGRLP